MPSKRSFKALWRPTLAIAATLVMVTFGVVFWHWAVGTTYRTQLGEWRRIRFEDGSVAILSEASEIRASFSGANRGVKLNRGQVVFDVVQDPHRPFFVVTPSAKIQALGTRFDVEYRNGPTRVTVVDGSVLVSPASDASQPNHTLILRREEGAEISGQTIVGSDQSQVAHVVALQRDVLVFDRQQLSVVAARINLSSRRQLRFADPAAGQKQISGRYMTDHLEGLVRAIQDLYPDLSVRETEDGWEVVQRTSGGPTQ